MSNSARNLIFTDQDYYRLFPNGIPTKKYQPRQLYPHEIRALKVILRNPLLENALRNEFGKRALTKTEINTLKVILRTHTNRAPVIEKIFEETLASIINPAPEEIVETRLITETETRPCLTFEENQQKRVQATEAYHKRNNIYGQQLQEQEYYRRRRRIPIRSLVVVIIRIGVQSIIATVTSTLIDSGLILTALTSTKPIH